MAFPNFVLTTSQIVGSPRPARFESAYVSELAPGEEAISEWRSKHPSTRVNPWTSVASIVDENGHARTETRHLDESPTESIREEYPNLWDIGPSNSESANPPAPRLAVQVPTITETPATHSPSPHREEGPRTTATNSLFPQERRLTYCPYRRAQDMEYQRIAEQHMAPPAAAATVQAVLQLIDDDEGTISAISSPPASDQLDREEVANRRSPANSEFSSESDQGEEGEDHDLPDDDSHISIASSESDEGSEYDLADRPWLQAVAFRAEWEFMYANVTTAAINGSWANTEDYQHEKDKEMLRYMEDYPINQWVIPLEDAKAAYMRLLERSRWRSLGVPVYGPRRIPEWIPEATVLLAPQQAPQQQAHHQMPVRGQGPASTNTPHYGPSNNQPAQHAGIATPMPSRIPSQLPGGPMPGHYPGQMPGQMPGQSQQMQHMQQQHQMGRGPGGPYPAQILRSEISGQPQMQPPMRHPQPMRHSQPPNMAPQSGQAGPSNTSGAPAPPHYASPYVMAPEPTPKPRKREPKPPPRPPTPPPRPPTPPYEPRPKPSGVEPKPRKNTGRRNARKQAEAEEFPWNRQGIDFEQAKTEARWDDSIYDSQTLEEMDLIRKQNEPFIDKIDNEQQEQQKAARNRKKAEKQAQAAGDAEDDGKPKERKKKEKKPRNEAGGDPYHSGNFSFADDEAKKKASDIGLGTPEEVIEACEGEKVDMDTAHDIKICWNPGKKGTTENLKQTRFSVRDTVRTRRQLETCLVLTHRAAECIVDFCPDMLWRGMLLRITSEAGYGNKDVRDRFCYNGCYCDKATITKRISAALGQKQTAPKAKGYADGEEQWYQDNVGDFSKYIDYFGKRTSHRNMLKIGTASGVKREREKDERGGIGVAGSSEEPPAKRAKTDDSILPELNVIESDHESDVLSEHESEEQEN